MSSDDSLIGHDADSRVLLAPEAVVITFTQPPPEDKEPPVIGFAPPNETRQAST